MRIKVKDIRVQPIDGKAAAAFVRRHHYSGKVGGNSQLHFGAFYTGKLHGVLSFGPPIDKSKVLGLVAGTGWNEMCELNRMAFDDFLPRNSESRVIGVWLRLLKKHCPHLKWVLSFADGTQCGDGTIHRATGTLLTGIRTNTSLYEFLTGHRIAAMTLEATFNAREIVEVCRALGVEHKYRTRKQWEAFGAKPIPGYQLRYIFLLDKAAKLTVPVLPYSKIDELGAGMYKGQNKPISECKPQTPAPEAQMFMSAGLRRNRDPDAATWGETSSPAADARTGSMKRAPANGRRSFHVLGHALRLTLAEQLFGVHWLAIHQQPVEVDAFGQRGGIHRELSFAPLGEGEAL